MANVGEAPIPPTPVLPYDAEVEYLQSDGNAYIDTGVKTTSDVRVVVSLNMSEPNGNVPIYGGRVAANNKSNALFYYKANNWSWRYGNEEKTIAHSGTLGDFITSNKTTARTMVISGAKSGSVSCTAATFTTDYNMYIFSSNNGGTAITTANSAAMKIKSVEMYDGSTLVRNYISVRKNGVGYLYDKVSGQLFGNANSTGAFTYGNDKT